MNKELSSTHLESDKIIKTIEDLIIWLEEQNLTNYDPYDIQTSFFGGYLQKFRSNFFLNILRKAFLFSEKLLPKLFRIFSKKTKSATSSSLFASSCFMLYYTGKDDKLLEKGEKEIKWLEENYSKGYSGFCWGLPFDWHLSEGITIKKGTPCSTILIYMAEAFLWSYKATGDSHYKDFAISISKFLINDLNKDIINQNTICSSYTPIDNLHIINVNSYVAATLYTISGHTGDKTIIDYSNKLINYVLKEQNPDGSWYYLGNQNRKKESVDSLHQCYILENLYRCYLKNKDKRLKESIQKGLNYFTENLFEEGKIKKFPYKKYKNYPLELIDHAEAIIMFSMLSNDFNTKEYAKKTVKYVFQKFKIKNKSYFYSYIIKSIPKDIPYIRWGESQILYALSFYYCIFIKRLKIEELLFP